MMGDGGYYPEAAEALRRLGYTVGDDPNNGDREETVSENKVKPGKRGRGRPRLGVKHLQGEVAEGDGEWYRAKPSEVCITRRHVLNLEYAARATDALTTDGRGYPLNDDLNDAYYEWAQVVRTELGRCGDRAAIRSMATRLLEALRAGECVWRAQDQVALLRRWRGVQKPQTFNVFDRLPDTLENHLLHAIIDYEERHEGELTDDIVAQTLDAMARDFAQSAAESKKEEMSSEKEGE